MHFNIDKIPDKSLVKFIILNQLKADYVGTDISIHASKAGKPRVFQYYCDARFNSIEIPEWVVENFISSECKGFHSGDDAQIQEENAIHQIMYCCDRYRLNIDAIQMLERCYYPPPKPHNKLDEHLL